MKRICIVAIPAIILGFLSTFAVELPQPPDVEKIASLVTRPVGNCNAADLYLKAEKIYRKIELKKSPEERLIMDEESEPFQLILDGLECRNCVFPYSNELKIPPYEQMIPMMALYNAAAKTFRRNGDVALEERNYQKAEMWYSKAVNLGLHLWYEPGITVIQDMITMACLGDGVEGLGDLYIARGNEDKAATCARFLAQKTVYLDGIPTLVKKTLARNPHRLTPEFREIVSMFPSVKYLPVKLEILLYTSELKMFVSDEVTQTLCQQIIDSGLEHPDARIRKLAEWANELSPEKMKEHTKDLDDSVFD